MAVNACATLTATRMRAVIMAPIAPGLGAAEQKLLGSKYKFADWTTNAVTSDVFSNCRIPWKEGYFTLTVGKLFGCLAECLSVCAWCRCRRQPPQQIRRYLGGDGSEEIGDEIPAAIRTRSVTKAERSPTLSSFVGVAAA